VIAAAGHVDGVAFPTADNVIAAYPIAVLRASQNPSAAQAFVADVASGIAHNELLREGFLPP